MRRCAGLLPVLAGDRDDVTASLLDAPCGQLVVAENATGEDGVLLAAQPGVLSGSVLINILTGERAELKKGGTVTVHLPVRAGCIDAWRVQ